MRARTRFSIAVLAVCLFTPLTALAQPGETDAVESRANEPVIELIDRGQSPRQALRLEPKVGQKQSLTMAMDMEMGTSMGGMTMPSQLLPTTVMTIETVVKAIKPNGDIVLAFEITDTDLRNTDRAEPFVAQAMRTSMESIEGLKGTSTTSSRGITRQGDISVPQEADEQTKAQFDQVENTITSLGVPFPIEEIGVGAKWTVTTMLNTNGITLEQITDCELVKIKGDSVQIRTKVRQSAKPQQFNAPGMPAGAQIKLTNFEGSGTSLFTILLDEMLPRKTESTVDIDIDVEISGAGMGSGVQAMSQSIRTEVDADGSKATR